jgi:hypothetical protein
MALTHDLRIREFETLDFSGKGEAFVESRFLTPLLECLGYEAHKDYDVIRHGDDGSAFKLHYPPVEKGADKVKYYNPDYIPTIRKKMFWIVEAKSPKNVSHPFDAKYLVQGFQYCIHPEIQAKYLLISNGLVSTVYDPYASVFFGSDMYEPIFEFRPSELSRRWLEIYDLLSVETLRTRIEASLKEMYDKLCVSSLDENYPRKLIRRIGRSQNENSGKIRDNVTQLRLAEFRRRSEVLKSFKEGLSADQAFTLMSRPLGWEGCEGAIFVEKSLANGETAQEIFAKLTRDFRDQSIFRKLQSFAAACVLHGKINDGPMKDSVRRFLDEHKDGDIPPLNQLECCFIRTVRKLLVTYAYSTIEDLFSEALKSAPELKRFVLPPTGFEESLEYELRVHAIVFEQLLTLSEPEIQKELVRLEQFENSLESAFVKASKESSLYKDASFTWFQSYGKEGRHFAFKNILHNAGIN